MVTNLAEIPLAGGALRGAIRRHYRCDESNLIAKLLPQAQLSNANQQQAYRQGLRMAQGLRSAAGNGSAIQSLLNQYSLSTHEGVVLMCLAEALLRVPDRETADRLIRDKLEEGDWSAHVGSSDSLFVNALAWGLLLSGKVVSFSDIEHHRRLDHLHRRLGGIGTPLVRGAMRQAMKIMGSQFVLGRTIAEACRRARDQEHRGWCYSFDMLGEASRTMADADACLSAYTEAIKYIGQRSEGRGVYDGAGISVKLSAIHPRYEVAQRERVMVELLPRLRSLALLARKFDIGLTVDAEEADRLELSLDVIEAVYADAALSGWCGFGIVVQAYQKRALPILEWAIDLSREVGRRMNIRLVKGAYWDTEIKRAQVDGLANYPVFTRKENTDVSYQACTALLLRNRSVVYPQFATHNAWTAAHVLACAGDDLSGFEFQRLHGMGEGLYEELLTEGRVPVRIYAPVGEYKDLLAYLVRRLLENGANSSFINSVTDKNVTLASLVEDPCRRVARNTHSSHPLIALPENIYGDARRNALGVDLSDGERLQQLLRHRHTIEQRLPLGKSASDGVNHSYNPADTRQLLGGVAQCSAAVMQQRLENAQLAFGSWSSLSAHRRGQYLEKLAVLLESHMDELVSLLNLEAGKVIHDSVTEVREAVDFCRYYAAEGRRACNATAASRGVVLCISPWNFPLAIFLGQITAALAAGNTVLAKPADATCLIAQRVLELIAAAGIPANVVQLIVAEGAVVGEQLLPESRIAAVLFTGSTTVGKHIASILASRTGARIPLIAETGGQNCLVVDSSALPEQVVDDVIASGFRSAGQRCSALRVLYLPEPVADEIIEMIIGAMRELSMGDPARLSTDVGPVIDQRALQALQQHTQHMEKHGRLLYQCDLGAACAEGTFFAPRLYEIENINVLEQEVFGPVVHVVRYRPQEFDAVMASINSTGFGLTAGVHSRVGATTRRFTEQVSAGNIYVNRNMIGAVVGVQPFGGHGLSGTGPKAGGPHYVPRLLSHAEGEEAMHEPLYWQNQLAQLASLIDGGIINDRQLAGPTGESNQWLCIPRGTVLCLDDGQCSAAGMMQVAAALTSGNRVLHVSDKAVDFSLYPSLTDFRPAYRWRAWTGADAVKRDLSTGKFDAVTLVGDNTLARQIEEILVMRPGALVPLIVETAAASLLPRLVLEKTISIDTTAAGGNTSLLTMGGKLEISETITACG